MRPLLALPALALLAGCPPVEGPPVDTDPEVVDTEVDSDSDVVPAAWSAVTRDAPEALMSVGGTSADDVWAVGAGRSRGPLVLHRAGGAWSKVATGASHELCDEPPVLVAEPVLHQPGAIALLAQNLAPASGRTSRRAPIPGIDRAISAA